MDLNTVTSVARPATRDDLPAWQEGDAWLAGGTWLFSEPQTGIRRLVDLQGLDWPSLAVTVSGLEIAATCTLAELDALELPPAWRAAPLIHDCCDALLGSFKIRKVATVGGNLCMALPAGPMIALAVALEATCLIWMPGGRERELPAAEFVLGPQRTALLPGEVLRAIDIPADAIERRSAFRRVSLSPLGRSGVLVIATLDQTGTFALTVTAATRRPVRLPFPALPSQGALRERLLSAITDDLYYDDVHGRPDWRRHMTLELADGVLAELGGTTRA